MQPEDDGESSPYRFCLSRDVHASVQVTVRSLLRIVPTLYGNLSAADFAAEGRTPSPEVLSISADLSLCSGGETVGPLVTLGPANYSGARPGGAGPKLSPPAARAHAQASQQDALAQSVVEACSWRDHTLQMGAAVKDLADDAQLCVCLRATDATGAEQLLGSSCVPLFSTRGLLKSGFRVLLVRPGVAPDPEDPSRVSGRVPSQPPGPEGRVPGDRTTSGEPESEDLARTARALRAVQRAKDGTARRSPWLDACWGPSGELPEVLARHCAALMAACAGSLRSSQGGAHRSAGRAAVERLQDVLWMDEHGYMWFLLLEFPKSTVDVLYSSWGVGGGLVPRSSPIAMQVGGRLVLGPVANAGLQMQSLASTAPPVSQCGWGHRLVDPGVLRDNLAEVKAQKLAQGGLLDHQSGDAVPDLTEKAQLEAILRHPFLKTLQPQERALLWRFRRRLASDPRNLPVFLRAVDWGVPMEVAEATQLMARWAPLSEAQALDLLGPDMSHPAVRTCAIDVLRSTSSDEDLVLYLPQLVQALRYELTPPEELETSPLAQFLVQLALRSPVLATSLHWYLVAEWSDPSLGRGFGRVHGRLIEELAQTGPQGRATLDDLRQQNELMASLGLIVKELRAMGNWGAGKNKAQRLRAMIQRDGEFGELSRLQVRLPIQPHLMACGIVASECTVFKSALSPLKLTFIVERSFREGDDRGDDRGTASGRADTAGSGPSSTRVGRSRDDLGSAARTLSPPPLLEEEAGIDDAGRGGTPGINDAAGGTASTHDLLPPLDPGFQSGMLERFVCIYKKGDDLRQDQLILQMFRLMDRIFKKENLDLRLVTYRVIATGTDDGLVEFIDSVALADILAQDRTIIRFLQKHNPDSRAEFQVDATVLDNFVRSCAGFCVMTYVLGIGDRHLDNLMVTRDGRLFHIDFGYILGRDPKPFPPPVKLCREMVDAMGGSQSQRYQQFQTLCCEAFDILRKNAPLVISLFHLMAGSTIPDIASQPGQATFKVLEKLHLELDSESARAFMRRLLEDSVRALMPQVMETAHRWAQYWR